MNISRLYKEALKDIGKINIAKTIYFNLKYLPFKEAICLPILVYNRTSLLKVQGNIIINDTIRPGILRIGPRSLGTQDIKYARTIWEVSGTLIIFGKTSIGRGCRISIGRNAVLTLGNRFNITGNTSIICQEKITFGNDCLLSWDILIMDSDFHKIKDKDGIIINRPQPIVIGDHVWIGCRVTILKGVQIGNSNIISANSLLSKSFKENKCIIGGHGKDLQILKKEVNWEM